MLEKCKMTLIIKTSQEQMIGGHGQDSILDQDQENPNENQEECGEEQHQYETQVIQLIKKRNPEQRIRKAEKKKSCFPGLPPNSFCHQTTLPVTVRPTQKYSLQC